MFISIYYDGIKHFTKQNSHAIITHKNWMYFIHGNGRRAMKKMCFTKWDMVSIGAVAVLAAAVFFLFLPPKTPATCAEIYKDGVLAEL